MPLHPFHWGVPGLLTPISQRRLGLVALMWGATLPDLDVIWIRLTENQVGHGFLHTFIGALVVGLMVVLLSHEKIRSFLRKLPIWGRLVDDEERYASANFAAGVLGAWSHILLDGSLYESLNPYLGGYTNPFYFDNSGGPVYLFTGLALLMLMAWGVRNLIRYVQGNMDKPETRKGRDMIWTKKFSVVLALTVVALTILAQTNIPTPAGFVITEVSIINVDQRSITLQGYVPKVETIMNEELFVEIRWEGGFLDLDLSGGTERYWFTGTVPDVDPGDNIQILLYLEDQRDGYPLARNPLYVASVNVPSNT